MGGGVVAQVRASAVQQEKRRFMQHCMRCGRSSEKSNMQGQLEGPRWLGKDSKHKLTRWGKQRIGEAFVWCRKCLGYARHQLGPKLMNRCKLEKIERVWTDAKRERFLTQTFLNSRQGGIRIWRLPGAKRGVEYRQKRILEDRGALLKEDGDLVSEYKAIHTSRNKPARSPQAHRPH